MEDLRYPIGKFKAPGELGAAWREEATAEIAAMPARMRAAVAGLSEAQLDTPYRPGGWTVRQVVHHVPESHFIAYTRMKLAVTEDEPTVKTYDESRWAQQAEVKTAPPEVSLALLEALHVRWVLALRALAPEDWQRTWRHPEHGRRTVEWLVALYAWHGRHHVAHVTSLRQREGW